MKKDKQVKIRYDDEEEEKEEEVYVIREESGVMLV